MIWLVYVAHNSIVALIKTYNWLQFQLLKLFTLLLIKKGKELAMSLGVVLNCPGGNEELFTEDKEMAVKMSNEYDTLVHI